jgi:hypothetical protein
MPDPRIKGQETRVLIIRDGDLQARIDSISSSELTIDLEILEEGYIGETSNRFDSVFNGVSINLTGHTTNDQVMQLASAIVDRAARRAGAAVRIDVAFVYIFPNGILTTWTIPDVQFGPFPMNTGSRTEYTEFTLEGQASEFVLA